MKLKKTIITKKLQWVDIENEISNEIYIRENIWLGFIKTSYTFKLENNMNKIRTNRVKIKGLSNNGK